MHNSDPNLHLLGTESSINWGEEFDGQPDSDPVGEKRHLVKQVVSLDEVALPDDVTSLEGSQETTELQPEEANLCSSPPVPGSPDDVQEIRGLLVKEFQVEVPVAVGDKVEEQLCNGAIIQESNATIDSLEEKEEAAARMAGNHPTEDSTEPQREVPEATAASSVKLPAQADHAEPSDKETGEEVSAQVCKVKAESALENSHESTDDSEGIQTQF